MNLTRAIGGFLLSFVFLIFFVYAILGMQSYSQNHQINPDKNQLLGSVMGGVKNVAGGDAAEDFIANAGLEINAQAAISVYADLSGTDKIIFNKNDRRKLSIASISKLMTALIVAENYDPLKEITISDSAANQSVDSEQLKVGETFYAKDLLYAMLIGSDNTASYALSESIGTDKFIGLMNAKAEEIGLSDTSFLNPTGLGLANFSTTYDLAKLAEYLLKNYQPIFAITAKPEFDFYTIDKKVLHKVVNTNELLNNSSGLSKRIIGGKTGETRTAGQCLLLIVRCLDGQGYLINVALNSQDRFGDMKKIINWADAIQDTR